MKKLVLFLMILVGIFGINVGSLSVTAENKETKTTEVRKILPNEDRTQIIDTTTGHYQSVCFIYVNNAVQGSGVVVGPNTILTNKHVANSAQNGDASKIRATPARESQTNYPFGSYQGADYILSPDGQDLAVVHLKPNEFGSIGEVVQPAEMENDPDTSVGKAVTVTGYPGDKPFGTMWESKGKSTTKTTNRIYYNASTYGGNSGSPVFNEENKLIGIHFGAVSNENMAVRLKPSIYNFITENIK